MAANYIFSNVPCRYKCSVGGKVMVEVLKALSYGVLLVDTLMLGGLELRDRSQVAGWSWGV